VAPGQQRLLRAVGEEAVAAHGGAGHGAGVHPQVRGGGRARRRGGLQGLVHDADPAIPLAEAVARAPLLRGGGSEGPRPSSRRHGRVVREHGGVRCAVRGGGAEAVRAGVLPAPVAGEARRREDGQRAQPEAPRGGERDQLGAVHELGYGGRHLHAEVRHREHADGGTPRPRSVESRAGSSCFPAP